MITSNDRLFCLLTSIEKPISTGRLNCYIYILQKLGFNLDFQFRVNVSGVRSKSFSRYLEEQVSTGFIVQRNGDITLTSESSRVLENFILTWESLDSVFKIKSTLDALSDDELYLVCIVDIIITDVIKSRGIDALVTSRNFVENSVKNLCSEYSEANFNLAVALIRKLKKECVLNE